MPKETVKTEKAKKSQKSTASASDSKAIAQEKKVAVKAAPRGKKTVKPQAQPATKAPKSEKYFQGVGRRKTAIAVARLFTKGAHEALVNEKTFEAYFPRQELREIALASLKKMKILDKFRVLVKVRGGGVHAQAEAVRHATARSLVKFNADFRKRLKRVGYLTRNARVVERKKYGLKKARRAPQWAKR